MKKLLVLLAKQCVVPVTLNNGNTIELFEKNNKINMRYMNKNTNFERIIVVNNNVLNKLLQKPEIVKAIREKYEEELNIMKNKNIAKENIAVEVNRSDRYSQEEKNIWDNLLTIVSQEGVVDITDNVSLAILNDRNEKNLVNNNLHIQLIIKEKINNKEIVKFPELYDCVSVGFVTNVIRQEMKKSSNFEKVINDKKMQVANVFLENNLRYNKLLNEYNFSNEIERHK